MHLYKVTIEAAVKSQHYYIVAQSFDEAETIAVDTDVDGTGGAENRGVSNIERLCECGGSDSAFTISDAAARSLGFN